MLEFPIHFVKYFRQELTEFLHKVPSYPSRLAKPQPWTAPHLRHISNTLPYLASTKVHQIQSCSPADLLS
jgi:hypothetical protein